MPGPEPAPGEWRRVHLQRNYLRNPLPAGPGVCAVCRGPAAQRLCGQCGDHERTLGPTAADVVVPISYAIVGTQHAYNLRMYKDGKAGRGPSRVDLTALLHFFLTRHGGCLARAVGAPPDAVAIVPSTRNRSGEHPLWRLAQPLRALPRIDLRTNPDTRARSHSLNPERFLVADRTAPPARRVLLLDDTWTSGSCVQAASRALKVAGAERVVAVVLGRWLKPEYAPSRPLLDRLKDTWFEMETCAVHDAAD